MRILAIRGENLASLAERFEIDFESEPLSGAGVFAITGETGAGKSTILDALCLALYDAFPRLSAHGVNEAVPDPSGQTMSAGDPRSILRRGAGRGFAEVDFIGRDGERYRARCDLARARGRATGNLQQRGRALHRIDADGSLAAAVASGVEPVRAKIVELTDLTFEQFRRTVLLAQGDFDAFLRADSRERADLLEKITGASIYADISRRVYQRAKAAQEAAELLRRRRDEVGLIADDLRAALEAECAQAGAARERVAHERDEAAALLRRHLEITQAEERLAQAAERQARASEALEGLAETRERLRALASAEPVRAPFAQRAAATTALGGAIAKDEAARARVALAASALEASIGAEALAQQGLDAAEAEFKGFGPQWSEADRLDSEIATAETESASAAQRALDAAKAAANKAAEETRLTQSLATAQAMRESALRALDTLAPAAPLDERWSEIARALEDRRAAGEALARGAARIATLAGVVETADREIAALDIADRDDSALRATLFGQIETRRAALAELKEEEASLRRRALADLVRLVAELRTQAQRHARARDALSRATQDGDAATAAQEKETRALQEAGAARAIAEARRGEVERLGEMADAAVSKEALRLRASLVPDAPCPVCGAREHPHAHASEAVDEMIAELRTRRDALRREIAAAETMIAAADGRCAAARDRAADAMRRSEEARAERDDSASRYDGARVRWRPGFVEAEPPAIEDAQALAALADAIDRDAALLDDKLERARALRADVETLRQKCDRLGAAIEDRRKSRDEALARAATAREETAGLSADRANVLEGLRAVDRTLSPFLPLCDLATADLDRDLAGATRRLAGKGEEFRKARALAEQTETSSAELARSLAIVAVGACDAAQAATSRAEERETRVAALAVLRARRVDLLGGEPTAAHRTRCNDKRVAAQQARDRAVRDRAEREAAKAGADRDLAHAAEALVVAGAQNEEASSAFARALVDAGLDEATALALLNVSATERAELRARLDSAEAATAAAATEKEARARDLESALAAGRPERDAESLEAARVCAEQALDTLARRLGEIGEKLSADDSARAKAQTLSGEIAAAEAIHKSWAEVDAAIGSATGDKFRRFAQSVTLEHLVALANRHLASLTARYRLERSSEATDLGLQIVDRDLGDERRSTRSLSGGERFLASLALALGLCSLEGRSSFVDTLFIDEGFGTLDQTTLDVAMDALERLHGQGRKVGVISHVDSLRQRIAVQIRVEKRGGGRSAVRIETHGGWIAAPPPLRSNEEAPPPPL